MTKKKSRRIIRQYVKHWNDRWEQRQVVGDKLCGAFQWSADLGNDKCIGRVIDVNDDTYTIQLFAS
jgi:hypothetical protein